MDVVESAIGHDDHVIARAYFRGKKPHDVFGGFKCRRNPALRTNSLDNTVRIECLLRRQIRCSNYLRDDREVGRDKRANECFFKYSTAACLRSRLEYRPYPCARIPFAHRTQGLLYGRGMMREI